MGIISELILLLINIFLLTPLLICLLLLNCLIITLLIIIGLGPDLTVVFVIIIVIVVVIADVKIRSFHFRCHVDEKYRSNLLEMEVSLGS